MPIDNKSLCSVFIVLIIMVSLCSVIIVHETTGESKTDTQGEYNILARVNTEGSGIYIKDTVLSAKGGVSAFYNTSTFEITEADNKAAWGGLVVGTPGAATIQHVQMQQIAEKAGLIFTLYQDGMSTDGDHMYYVATMSNAATVTQDSWTPVSFGNLSIQRSSTLMVSVSSFSLTICSPTTPAVTS